MKKALLFITLLLISISATSETEIKNQNYDAQLAKKVGADDYGMKSYVFVILKSGDNQSTDTEVRNKSFRGHMNNMRRLAEEEKLVLAGPFGKNNKDYRGLFILNVTTIEQAEELLSTDPTISAGYLSYEMTPWYGSAAISEYLEASDKVWKVKP
ncbi:MAG: YciI family protein [Marinicellaceae bacterium]